MNNQTASNKRRQLHTTAVSLFDSAVAIVLCRAAAAARVICLFNYLFVVADAVDRGSWLRDSKASRYAPAFLLCVV